MGGLPTFATLVANSEVAPIAAVGLLVITGQPDQNRPLRATRLNKFRVGSERSFAELVVRGAPDGAARLDPKGVTQHSSEGPERHHID